MITVEKDNTGTYQLIVDSGILTLSEDLVQEITLTVSFDDMSDQTDPFADLDTSRFVTTIRLSIAAVRPSWNESPTDYLMQ